MTRTTSTTDRIEKSILLHVPRSRLWRALTTASEFGIWFGVELHGEFAEGRSITGRITTPNYDHLTMELQVVRIDPERLFSYRWHPYAIDQTYDYSKEPSTLVEFHLADRDDGVALTVIESGFDSIPPARRAEAFRMNDRGWGAQLANIERHVSKP